MFKFYRYLFPGLIALALGFRLGSILLIRPAPVIDEPLHLKVAQQFGPGLPAIAQLRDYPSATGPFFYVLFGNLGALFGYNLTLLRVAVFALALGSLLLFHRILKRLLPAESPMPAVTLLATAPYFPALAGVFMTEHLAFFLGLAALLCYLRSHAGHDRENGGCPAPLVPTVPRARSTQAPGTHPRHVPRVAPWTCPLLRTVPSSAGSWPSLDLALALLFATLAIYTRIYYAFLPAAFAVADIISTRSSSTVHRPSSLAHPSSFIPHPSSLSSAALWLLPILAFLPMALLWRGLAPPTYQYMYHPGFQWQNASSLFIWTGIFFLPWVWRKPKPWHLIALLAIPAVLLAPLPGLGITRSALKLLPHPLALIAACLFGVVGLLWYVQIAPLAIGRDTIRNPQRISVMSHSLPVAAIGTLLLVAGLLVSGPVVYERYLLPGIPLMLICARPGTKPGLALAWAGLFQLPVALAHILHLAA